MGNKLRKSKSNDKNYGDYILINDNLKYIVENIVPVSFVYNAKKTPTSDHLPVMSILRLKKSIKNKSLK
jgi:exonuclease III